MIQYEKIYVTHYSPLAERKKRLEDFFNKNNLNVEWVENENVEKGFYEENSEEWNRKIKIAYPTDKTPPRELLKTEVSVAVKHYECFKRIAESNHEYAVIFEDDVVFNDSFIKDYPRYMSQTPHEWDAIFFGNGSFLRINNATKDKLAYMLKFPTTRCLDSYIIKKSACEKILEDLKPITLPIDFELSYSFIKNNLKVCWWEPSLTNQGSQIRLYKSSIR